MAELRGLEERPVFRLFHVGVNAASAAEAAEAARLLSALFGFAIRDTDISVYGGEAVEIMKGCGRGSRGHIAFATPDMGRAVAFLRARGVEIVPETMKTDSQGRYGAVYLRQEVCGFAIHLVEQPKK